MWYHRVIGGERCPIVDTWWQTETGWSIAANCVGYGMLPVKAGSPTKAAPGWRLEVMDENCHAVPNGQVGALCGKLPMPPKVDINVTIFGLSIK